MNGKLARVRAPLRTALVWAGALALSLSGLTGCVADTADDVEEAEVTAQAGTTLTIVPEIPKQPGGIQGQGPLNVPPPTVVPPTDEDPDTSTGQGQDPEPSPWKPEERQTQNH